MLWMCQWRDKAGFVTRECQGSSQLRPLQSQSSVFSSTLRSAGPFMLNGILRTSTASSMRSHSSQSFGLFPTPWWIVLGSWTDLCLGFSSRNLMTSSRLISRDGSITQFLLPDPWQLLLWLLSQTSGILLERNSWFWYHLMNRPSTNLKMCCITLSPSITFTITLRAWRNLKINKRILCLQRRHKTINWEVIRITSGS